MKFYSKLNNNTFLKLHLPILILNILLPRNSYFSNEEAIQMSNRNASVINKILAFFFAPLSRKKKRKHVFLLSPCPFCVNLTTSSREIKLNEIEFPRALFRGSRYSTFCAIRNGNVLIVFHVDKMCSRHEPFSLFFISSVYSKQSCTFFFFSLKKLDISWNRNSISNRRVILKR